MSGEFSRDALRARLGDEVFEQAEALGRSAPEPSPQLVEQVRRIFAAAEDDGRARAVPRREPLAA